MANPPPAVDIETFIRRNLRLATVPLLPEIKLYSAHPGSGLGRVVAATAGDDDETPYWAYTWAGGMALALYFTERPDGVAGKRVLDLGAGCGLVGIAAALAGASEITAVDIDANARSAALLNAAANGVSLRTCGKDILDADPPDADIVAIGDLFYDPDLAVRVGAFAERCAQAGMDILIGDPWRAHLPRKKLRLIAEYSVPDFGTPRDRPLVKSGVFQPFDTVAAGGL